MPSARVSQDGVFYTLQGEGPLIGVPSVFVRLDTCNLRCKWGDILCDAHYTSWTPGELRVSGEDLVDQVFEYIRRHKCRHLVITGGEPLLQEEVVQLLCREALIGKVHSTIETNGTKFISCSADLICISPKLKSSTPVGTKYEAMHVSNRWNPITVKRLMECYEYYFKFVIDDPDRDVPEVLGMLEEVGQKVNDPWHVLFMPQGIDSLDLEIKGKALAEWCKKLGVRMTPRLQVSLWGNTPGT